MAAVAGLAGQIAGPLSAEWAKEEKEKEEKQKKKQRKGGSSEAAGGNPADAATIMRATSVAEP